MFVVHRVVPNHVTKLAAVIAGLSNWTPDERSKLLDVKGPGWYAGPVAIVSHAAFCPCAHDDPDVLCLRAPVLLQGGVISLWWVHARWFDRPPEQTIELLSDVWVPISLMALPPVAED